MGTRGLLGHIIRGRKKAMYNHFDSYPVGLGLELAKFIKSLSAEELEKMKQMVDALEWINDGDEAPKELQERYTAFQFANLAVGSQKSSHWFCLLYNTQGAKALPHIFEGTLTHQIDDTNFENDTLFCEWTYFIDWEKQEVHVRKNNDGMIDETCTFDVPSEEWMRELEKKLEDDEDDDDASVD